VSTALRTLVDGGIRHFLALLEAALALLAKIFVGWQENLLEIILSPLRFLGCVGRYCRGAISFAPVAQNGEHGWSDQAY
jgi:hypothetical protein